MGVKRVWPQEQKYLFRWISFQPMTEMKVLKSEVISPSEGTFDDKTMNFKATLHISATSFSEQKCQHKDGIDVS